MPNLSLIGFTVWSSVLHAAIMAGIAVADSAERGHLVGDVPALLLVAGALAFLTRHAAVRTETTNLGIRRVAPLAGEGNPGHLGAPLSA